MALPSSHSGAFAGRGPLNIGDALAQYGLPKEAAEPSMWGRGDLHIPSPFGGSAGYQTFPPGPQHFAAWDGRQGFPEHMVLGHFFPTIWDLQCWYSGHQCVANPIWSSGWGCYLVVIAITLGQPVPNMHCLGGTGLFLPCG